MCNKIKVIVNDLKKTEGQKIIFNNVLVGSGKSKEELKKAKIKGHGLVAHNKDGELVKAIEGHVFGKKEVQAVVKKLLVEK